MASTNRRPHEAVFQNPLTPPMRVCSILTSLLGLPARAARYRISNIRDLFGHQVDVNQTKNAPLARFP